MALIIIGVTLTDFTASQVIVQGTIALSGNYGTASSHGDTLSLAGAYADSSSLPTSVVISENTVAGSAGSGWRFVFNPGTTQVNGVVQMFGSGTSGQGQPEYTQGSAYASATPAPPTKLYFTATFPKL